MMEYFDDILNVYAYLFSKSQKLVEDATKITEGISELTGEFEEIDEKAKSIDATIDADILTLRALAEELGIDVSDIPSAPTDAAAPKVPEEAEKLRFGKIELPDDFDFEKDFERLVAEAHEAGFTNVHPEELLSKEEIEQASGFEDRLDAEFAAATGLTKGDIAVVGVAVIFRVFLHFIMQKVLYIDPQYPLGESNGSGMNHENGTALPDGGADIGNIDATQGYDIGDMMRDMKMPQNLAQVAGAAALSVPDTFFKPVNILDYNTILNMDRPFELRNTSLFEKNDILAYNKVAGWVMGVANLLTNTVTTFNMRSYSVNRADLLNGPYADKEISTLSVLRPVIRNLSMNKESVVAATLQEALTLGFGNADPTKIRLLYKRSAELENRTYHIMEKSTNIMRRFNFSLASCMGEIAAVTLLNSVISALHAMMYDEEKDGSLDLFSIRTGKIILCSGAVSTIINSIPAFVNQDITKLDFPGMITTLFSYFSSTKFWIEVKAQFLFSEYKKELDKEMEKIDKYFL